MVKKLFSDLFPKKQTWAYLWIKSPKFYTVCLYCMPSWRLSKLSCKLLAFTSFKVFLRNKKGSEVSPPASFSAWFLKKNIYLVIVYYMTKFYGLVAFTSWVRYWAKCVLQLFICQLMTSKILKLILTFYSSLFLHDQKVKTKI